jgi:hypothetical protein
MFKSLVNKDLAFVACSQLIFGIIGALLVHFMLNFRAVPTIATVNITALEDSFVREISKKQLSEVEMRSQVMGFAKAINQTVFRLCKQKHLILVPSEAVMAGSQDMTQEVAAQVKKGLIS